MLISRCRNCSAEPQTLERAHARHTPTPARLRLPVPASWYRGSSRPEGFGGSGTHFYLLYLYISTNADAGGLGRLSGVGERLVSGLSEVFPTLKWAAGVLLRLHLASFYYSGTQFTCFPGIKVQILTLLRLHLASVSLLSHLLLACAQDDRRAVPCAELAAGEGGGSGRQRFDVLLSPPR